MKDVDGRDKPGHDERCIWWVSPRLTLGFHPPYVYPAGHNHVAFGGQEQAGGCSMTPQSPAWIESGMISVIRSPSRSSEARAMRSSAKVIAFPVRAGWHPPSGVVEDVQATRQAPVSKLKLFLVFLLAPLIVAASALAFLAVVGVFLVWFVIVSLLVVGMIIFARRLLLRRRRPPISGFPHRMAG